MIRKIGFLAALLIGFSGITQEARAAVRIYYVPCYEQGETFASFIGKCVIAAGVAELAETEEGRRILAAAAGLTLMAAVGCYFAELFCPVTNQVKRVYYRVRPRYEVRTTYDVVAVDGIYAL